MEQTDLSADAMAAKPLRQVTALTRWVGTGKGRKLTQTGRLTLADARGLVALLDTGDVLDPIFEGQVRPRRTSEQFEELSVVLAWAKEAGLVRVQQGRLVEVKENGPLLDRPVDLWATLFTGFPRIVEAIFPTASWRPSPMTGDFPNSVGILLRGIGEHGRLSTPDASELVWRRLMAPYRMEDASQDDARNWREAMDRDLRRTLDALLDLGALATDGRDRWSFTPLANDVLRRGYGPDRPGNRIAALKVTLLDIEPPVWRRVLVPVTIRLDRLHRVIQAAMGWQNDHLHMFSHGDDSYGVPDADLDLHDERRSSLDKLAARAGESIRYEYDFGDSWDHEILLEELVAAEDGARYPVCVDGARACPPEDSGGTGGYDSLIQTLADSAHPEHQSMAEWLSRIKPSDFDPARFDVAEANLRLEAIVRGRLPTS